MTTLSLRPFNRRSAAIGASSILLATAALADGPGMLLYSSGAGRDEYLRAPFRRYRFLAETAVTNFGSVYAAVDESGRPSVFATPISGFLDVPSGADDIVQIGVTSTFLVAIDSAGTTFTWPIQPAWMPAEPLSDISVSTNAVAGVGHSGSIYVWNSAAQLSTSTQLSSSRRVAISSGWGVAIGVDGVSATFGYGGSVPPAIPAASNLRDISVGGTASSARAIAMRPDGSLTSLLTDFTVPGSFEKVSVGVGRFAALGSDSIVTLWNWNTTVGNWSTPLPLKGSFKDVVVPSLGSVYFAAICATDTDHNGEDDRAQIIRGEIPDVNGDLIDDRSQGTNVLWDDNANGIADAAEVAAIASRFDPVDRVWYAGSGARQAGFFALDRVPVQAETLREVRLPHITSDVNGASIVGKVFSYGIWLDPNGDGSPLDAVEIFRTDVTLNKDRVSTIDLGDIYVGPPGTSFFHGIVYRQAPGEWQPALFPAWIFAEDSADPLHASRLRSRCWYSYREAGAAPATAVGLLRSAEPFEASTNTRVLSNLSVTWNDRRPADCDGDGMLDQDLVNGVFPFWIPDLDVNRNGMIDSCEQDCDLDGVFNVTELLAGAVDCNLDLVPDACAGTTFVAQQSGPVPGSDTPVEFVFGSLPPPSGNVSVIIEAVADLGAPTELLLYRFDGGQDLVIFGPSGSDCPATPDNTGFIYTAEQFNAARADGSVRIRIASSALVDPLQCAGGFVRARIEYLEGAPGSSDCDDNGIDDSCQHGADDCDGNGTPDVCEIGDPARDADGNGILDACELDCNRDGTPDRLQINADPSLDCDASGYLDECEYIDCNQNGINDACELIAGQGDCNGDGILDACQSLPDCDADGVPDPCESDCDGNGTPDDCDTANGAPDKDGDHVPDSCEYARGDFDLDGFLGPQDLAYLLSVWGATGLSIGDLNSDGVIGPQDLTIFLSRWGPA